MKIAALFCALATAGALWGGEAEVTNLYSGKAQSLPGAGPWTLTASHGRKLADGVAGTQVELSLPAMERGTSLEATLTVNGKARSVRIWSPWILAGFDGRVEVRDSRLRGIFAQLGIGGGDQERRGRVAATVTTELPLRPGALTLIFPQKRDFPMDLGRDWTRIVLARAKIAGNLGVLIDSKEQIADIGGAGSYLELTAAGCKMIVFPPDFDFEQIENVLLIQQLLKENLK